MGTPPDREAREPVARCLDVHKTYGSGDGAAVALAGIDLELLRGEVVALTGPSGSGKSTLLHLLGAMDSPTKGRVVVAGSDLAGLDDEAASAFRNRHVGFIFQFFHLLPSLPAGANIALPARLAGQPESLADERARVLAERVGVLDLLDRLPERMSGGQRQRVAIARALVNEPALVLADEPTGNLDHVAGGEVMDLLAALGHEHQVAVLVATHDPAVRAAADREIRLEDGRVVS